MFDVVLESSVCGKAFCVLVCLRGCMEHERGVRGVACCGGANGIMPALISECGTCCACACVAGCGVAWCGVAGCGVAGCGVALRCVALRGVAWRGVARCRTLVRAGLRKPDVRIYELACKKAAVEPSQCVFLDDIGANLKPAKNLGMASAPRVCTVCFDPPLGAVLRSGTRTTTLCHDAV